MNDAVSLQTLEEMKRYYQASASEYDAIFNRQGRYDQGPELNARWFAVDASAEMLAINQAKVASPRVSYVLADLFSWQPERVFDALFFGFWISHVPREQLDAFLRSCWTWLRLVGKMFFVDDTGW